MPLLWNESKNANALHAELESAPPAKPPAPGWSELKRRFGWEWNGMRLHEICFGNLTKKSQPAGRNGALSLQITHDFRTREGPSAASTSTRS